MNAAERADAVEVLARTIYGEARGENIRGKEAIAAVIINRVKHARDRGGYWWGGTVIDVCTKPWQFSCWNPSDPNRTKITQVQPGHRVYDTCCRIALRAINGTLDDPSDGATHYHATGFEPPWAWGRAPCAAIGRHQFYRGVE